MLACPQFFHPAKNGMSCDYHELFPAVLAGYCDCALELHVGASRWAQIDLRSASPVFVTCWSALPKVWPQHQFWGHSTHRWPGVGRTVRGPLCTIKETLGFWPTYWMLSRWQRDDALTCSLGSEYFCGYLGRVRLCIVCQAAYMHLDTLPKGPSHGLASGG